MNTSLYRRLRRNEPAWLDRIHGQAVLLELSDRQAERFDGLKLGKNARFLVHFSGVRVIGHGQEPVLCPGLVRVTRRLETVEVDERCSLCHDRASHRLLGHRSDRGALHLVIALLDLSGQNL